MSQLPRVLEVNRLISGREAEVSALLASLQPRAEGGGRGAGATIGAPGLPWGGAALPRSARRRATSHNPKKRKKAAVVDVNDSGAGRWRKTRKKKKDAKKAKRRKVDSDVVSDVDRKSKRTRLLPRKVRRKKPWKLVAERVKAATATTDDAAAACPAPLLLETHLWHAKRMCMGRPWADDAEYPSSSSSPANVVVAVGAPGAGRGDRAVASAVSRRALAHDASYWRPLVLSSESEGSLLRVLDAALIPGWREREKENSYDEGVEDEEKKSKESKRRKKRQQRRLGFSSAVLSGEAEADAILSAVSCPVRVMFWERRRRRRRRKEGSVDVGVGGEGGNDDDEKSRSVTCLVWVHAAAEASARLALQRAIEEGEEKQALVRLDAAPAPLRRLEVVGLRADAVVFGAVGAALPSEAPTVDDGGEDDGAAWSALRASLRGGGGKKKRKSDNKGNNKKKANGSDDDKSSNNGRSAFSSLPSGCALRITALDPRLRRAPREVRSVVSCGGGGRGGRGTVVAAAEASLGKTKKKKKRKEKSRQEERELERKENSTGKKPTKHRRSPLARVAALLSARKRVLSSSSSPPSSSTPVLPSSPSLRPLPTKSVSALRSAARRAALGVLPLPRKTAKEVERALRSLSSRSESPAASASVSFPLVAVRRYPAPPPRLRRAKTCAATADLPPPRLPHWSLVVPEGWALPLWRSIAECGKGGVGGGGGSGGRRGRGKGVAVAGQREWLWASSLCPSNPCLSHFYPDEWVEGERARRLREVGEWEREADDAKRPPGKKKDSNLLASLAPSLLSLGSFRVARAWPQVREALRGDDSPPTSSSAALPWFVPASISPERRGTLEAGALVFSLLDDDGPGHRRRGEFLGVVTKAPPRGSPAGVSASGIVLARELWRERRLDDEKGQEGQQKKKRKKKPLDPFVRVVVVLSDGREIVSRVVPLGAAAAAGSW